jgi:hypothetical protein
MYNHGCRNALELMPQGKTMMRFWTWLTGMAEGVWLALRHWRRQTKAEDAASEIPEDPPVKPGSPWIADALVGGKLASGAIVKRNCYTVWFQLADGRTIKRHIRKHNVIESAW